MILREVNRTCFPIDQIMRLERPANFEHGGENVGRRTGTWIGDQRHAHQPRARVIAPALLVDLAPARKP